MTSFLNACGLSDSLKLSVEGADADHAEVRLLQQPFAVIGRDLRADVVLEHSQVSRRHVYLQVIEGRAFWIDLASRVGTRAGRRIQNLGWLEGSRTLGIGPYEVRISISAAQNDDSSRSFLPRNAPFLVRAYSQVPLPEVALEFLNGPSRSTRWPVHRVMSLLGSASGCKLRLTDPSVSRCHASLLRTPAGLWVVDLLGESGITVNSTPVRFSRLEDGDVLEIGRYHMRIQVGSPSSRSLSTLRLQNGNPNALKVPDWVAAAAAMGFPTGSGSPQAAEIPLWPRSISPSSSIEIARSDSPYPVKAGQSDSTDSMLVPLVHQFGLMQQQMFDQFQQAMSMLVQMFGKMHHDQMEVIRTELDRLHELTEELQSLKDELGKRTRDQSQPISSELRRKPAVSDPSGVRRQDVLPGTSPAQTPPPRVQTTAPHKSPTNPSDSDGGADPEKDTIIWLHQRIMSIQSEREGRWQKILKLLPGIS
jgi:pSer/pThr/pTyr-binding forkhead associated (FHA) protein